MKLIKPIFGTLGLLLLAFLFFAAVSPKTIVVKKDITIKADNVDVFNYLKSLKATTEASVWAQKDANIKKEFEGKPDGEIGSVYRWESKHKEVGIGEQEIIGLRGHSDIETELRFKIPFESKDIAKYHVEDTEIGTKVTWSYESAKIPFPFNAFVDLQGVQGQLEKDFETTLQNYKTALEKK